MASTALLAISAFVVVAFVFAPLSGGVHAQAQPLPTVQTKLAIPPSGPPSNLVSKVPGSPGVPPSTSSDPTYDEQLGTTFTQDFTAILYNVTAVEQTDSASGAGPAYFLNGLSNTGYWYQAGLSYDWPRLDGGHSIGFYMNYEVFDTAGNSIFPLFGGGLGNFSGTVNQGDTVALNLYFTNSSQVVMLAKDQNTGAFASREFSAEGATYFVGSPFGFSDSNGFFTGLMTEWYHPGAYYGDEQKVTYSTDFALSSAWMWIDEFECSGTACSIMTSLFSSSTPSPVQYSNPSQLQTFSSNGAHESGDAYEFVTGAISIGRMTLSYAVNGGGSGYSSPVFTYVSNGSLVSTALSLLPTSYLVDANTTWSVTVSLPGSNANERWETNQQTSGTGGLSQTVAFSYFHQYLEAFDYRISGSGGTPPYISYYQFGVQQAASTGIQVWADADSQYVYQNPLPGSTSSVRWSSSQATGLVTSATDVVAPYYLQYAVTASYSVINGAGGGLAPEITATSFGFTSKQLLGGLVWLDAGSNYTLEDPVVSGVERLYAATGTSGMATPDLVISTNYYHQYSLALSYLIVGGGTGYRAPTVSYRYAGTTANVTLSANQIPYWMDSGSEWSLSNPLQGSTASERWATSLPSAGEVISASSHVFVFYHQYLLHLDFSVLGGGSGYSPPRVSLVSLGNGTSVNANASVWGDFGTPYSFLEVLDGSTAAERLASPTSVSGNITSPTTVMVSYQHQVYAVVRPVPQDGGTVSPTSGWYDVPGSVELLAKANPGWQFENWMGGGVPSYSGRGSNTSIDLGSPLIENATFYPGLVIIDEGYGGVSGTWAGGQQTVGSGSGTLYVPVGMNVSVVAAPSSVLFVFNGYRGAVNSTKTDSSVVVSSPTTVEAIFVPNYPVVGGLVGVVALATMGSVFIVRGRRRRGASPPETGGAPGPTAQFIMQN
ncbi:MAG TPA: hypothetical protein VKF15_05370, partial [Nitrososphaerales archaeon]|nr:hypothetical protein [Nitrososphaerales archaeon]